MESEVRLRAVAVALFVLGGTIFGSAAHAADPMPTEYRVGTAIGKSSDTTHVAVAFGGRAPRILQANRLELAAGAFLTGDDSSWFVSLGPVWRFSRPYRHFYFEFGFSPTFMSDPGFAGLDVGGKLHFTSSAAVAAQFGSGDALAVSLRIQHTSNGGLNGTNPGIDILGLNFRYNFSGN